MGKEPNNTGRPFSYTYHSQCRISYAEDGR